LRFPQTHFCPDCKRLYERPLTERGHIPCDACKKANRRRFLTQVPFIAICDRGHIQDFPWREWVHGKSKVSCTMQMRLISTGGPSVPTWVRHGIC
jgi:hypothetical protein